MLVKIFLAPDVEVVQHDIAVKEIISAFRTYKETGNPGHIFGADVPTERPKEARENKLFHMHLLKESDFQIKKLYLKHQEKRTSDSFLLYCSGYANKNYYLLIGFIWDDAHSKLNKSTDLLIRYGKEAEKFRNIY